MKYVIYCRRSSEREDRQTLSLEAQNRELLELAEKRGLDVAKIFTESQSAYKSGRPVFASMIQLIQGGLAEGIIVWHTSRLSRNSKDAGDLIYMMDEGTLKQIVTPDRTYNNTGDDKLFLALEFGMSKKSSDDTADYMKRDAKSKLLKGEFPGMAPVGYLNIGTNGTIAGGFYDHEKQTALANLGRPLKRVEKDPVIAPLMRIFFEHYLAERRTQKEMVAFINRLGIKSPRLKGKYSISMVERILKNPFYCGQLRYEGVIYEGVHEPIISVEEFNEIQRRLKDRSRPNQLTKQEFVYRGVLKCGECGCAITGTRKKKPSGKEYEFYGCTKRRGKCSQRSLKPAAIDAQVEERLAAVNIDERVWKLCVKLLQLHNSEKLSSTMKLREKWERDLKAIDTAMSRLLDLRLSGEIDEETFRNKRLEMNAQKEALMGKLNENVAAASSWIEQTEDFFALAHYAYTKFKDPATSLEQRKHIVKSIGWNLVILDGLLHWEYKKPFDMLATQVLDFKTVGTPVIGEGKKKTTSSEDEVAFWRDGRDSNPQLLP